MRFAVVLFIACVVSACGGDGPLSPTSPSNPTTPGYTVPNPTTPQGPLSLSPSSVTMTVGQTVTFTASGGSGQYVFEFPISSVFVTEQISYNQIKVRMTYPWKDPAPIAVRVDGVENGYIKTATALIYCK